MGRFLIFAGAQLVSLAASLSEHGVTDAGSNNEAMSLLQFQAHKHLVISETLGPGAGERAVNGPHDGSVMEAGFNRIAAKKDPEAMLVFIRNLIEQSGGEVVDESALKAFAPLYSGEKSSRTYQQLRAELRHSTWAGFWKLPKKWMAESDAAEPNEQNDADANPAVQMENGQKIEAQSFALKTDHVNSGDSAKATDTETVAPASDQPSAPADSAPDAAETAPLNEEGYKQVAADKDTSKMVIFIKRVVQEQRRTVQDDSKLHLFAKYHSGEKSTQSFKQLLSQLRKAPWVTGMNPAPEDAAHATEAH